MKSNPDYSLYRAFVVKSLIYVFFKRYIPNYQFSQPEGLDGIPGSGTFRKVHGILFPVSANAYALDIGYLSRCFAGANL